MKKLIALVLFFGIIICATVIYADNKVNKKTENASQSLEKIKLEIDSVINEMSGAVDEYQMASLIHLVKKFQKYKETLDGTEVFLDTRIINACDNYDNHFFPRDRDGKSAIWLSQISEKSIDSIGWPASETFAKALLIFLCYLGAVGLFCLGSCAGDPLFIVIAIILSVLFMAGIIASFF